MMALTESLLVSLSRRMASALEHLPYSMTILMFSGLRPSSERSSAEVSSTLGASTLPSALPSVLAASPSGLTGLVNWLTSFCPAPIPSRLGFPKMTQALSAPGDFHTSGSSILITNQNNPKNYSLALLNSNTVDARNLFQAHLAHSLLELLLAPVTLLIIVIVSVIVAAVLIVFVLVLVRGTVLFFGFFFGLGFFLDLGHLNLVLDILWWIIFEYFVNIHQGWVRVSQSYNKYWQKIAPVAGSNQKMNNHIYGEANGNGEIMNARSGEITERDGKIRRMRDEIRSRFHEEYFRSVRSEMNMRESLWGSQGGMGQGDGQKAVSMGQQIMDPPINNSSNKNYRIKLNNSQQLFPHPNPNLQTPHPQLTDPHLYTNLYSLVDLYNKIHSGQINHPETLHLLINKILQQIEIRMMGIKVMCQMADQEGRGWDDGVVFLLFIVYRRVEDLLQWAEGRGEGAGQYRWKLMQICKDSGSFGSQISAKFGLSLIKAIGN